MNHPHAEQNVFIKAHTNNLNAAASFTGQTTARVRKSARGRKPNKTEDLCASIYDSQTHP